MVIWSNQERPVWWHRTRSVIVLVAIGVAVVLSGTSRPWPHLVAVGALVLISIAGRLPYIFDRDPSRWLSASLVSCGAVAVALTLLEPSSAAVVFLAFPVVTAVVRWSPPEAVALAMGLAVGYDVGQIALGRSLVVLILGPAVLGGSVLLGMVRRQSRELAAQIEAAREEHIRSVALDERSRIAREIHDVLAHALAALAVQLETADALLESGRAEQARASVRQASGLAREGLVETRRAIGALRGDTLPLPELLATLASAYRADLSAPATVRVEGTPRDLPPDVSLALYRSAQEAITNVRKHAPGAPIEVGLRYRANDVHLVVGNGPAAPGERPLAGSGGGYGLTGLRERAELAGGEFRAGPTPTPAGGAPGERGWRIDVRIPA